MRLNPSDYSAGASNKLESLTWVLEEVRKSASIATGALAHVLSEKVASQASTQGAGAMASSSNLKTAYHEMRRAAGALRMVGQEVSGEVFSDIATLMERSAQAPELITEPLLKSVKSICFAVNAYLLGISNGRVWPTTVLSAVAQTAAGLAGRLAFHPAQLWVDQGKNLLSSVAWDDCAIPAGTHPAAEPDSSLLHLLKGELQAGYDLAHMCRLKGQATQDPGPQTLAFCGAVFLVSVAQGVTTLDLYAKRSIGKLTQWLNLDKRQEVVSLGLLHELKYFLSRIDVNAKGHILPALTGLGQQGFLVDDQALGIKTAEFRVIDPELLEEANRQLHAAKHDWSQLSAGELALGVSAIKHFSGLHQAMLKLWPDLAVITTSLNRCAQWVTSQNQAPTAGLSLEVATALLFLEDTLGDLYSSDSGLKEKAQALFTRLEQVRAGTAPLGLRDWMEALFRRSGEKQTMGNVAGELRHLAAEIERQFESVFGASLKPESPIPVQKLQGPLTQMKGVLGVVGLEQGVAAVTHLRLKTDSLERELRNPELREGLIANIGTNMASLGLMVDMLSYQPSLANRLFLFDKSSLTLLMLSHQTESVASSVQPTQVPDVTKDVPKTGSPVAPVSNKFIGDELTGVFVQEAHEVVEEGLDSVSALAANAKDIDTLISLRRGFHTLKGSARMVGMGELGEAAWAMEQVLNEQLTDEAKPVSANLCALAKDALGVIGRWSDMLGQGQDPGWTAEPFRLAAQAIREHDRYMALHMPEPGAVVRPAPEPVPSAPVAQAQVPEQAYQAPAVPAPVPPVVLQPAVPELSDWFATPDAPEETLKAAEPVDPLEDFGHDFIFDDLDPVPAPYAPSPSPAHTAESAVRSEQAVHQVDTDPDFDFDLDLDLGATLAESEQFKVIGPLKIRFNLYNVYLQEADEISRALEVSLTEWLLEPHQALPEQAVHHAHTLAGSSATVGFDALADLCKTLETVCGALRDRDDRSASLASPLRAGVEAVRFLLHQFAAGFLKQPDPAIANNLKALLAPVEAPEAHTATGQSDEVQLAQVPDHGHAQTPTLEPQSDAFEFEPELQTLQEVQSFDAVHAFSDQDIWNLFIEEAAELVPHISHHLHLWLKPPHSHQDRAEVLRGLHTLKGSARLAGAMELGDAVHQMESDLELLEPSDVQATQALSERFDHIAQALDPQAPQAAASPVSPVVDNGTIESHFPSPAQDEPIWADAHAAPLEATLPPPSASSEDSPTEEGRLEPAQRPPEVSRTEPQGFMTPAPSPSTRQAARQDLIETQDISPALRQAPVRVNARLLDTVMNRAGEVIGSRARVKLEVDHLRASLSDLNTNVEKLRAQLREIEIQAESQMQSRLALHKEADSAFDPLEFDRFTRVQELTRMMAESVSDVATVQRNLQRSVDHADDSLVAQGRQSRELQRELLRTRMVPFETIAQRLHRTVRQAARDAGKSVQLEIEGGNLELDRQQLDRLGPSLEHLIRNAVAHGIESAPLRAQAGKPVNGLIHVSVRQDRNDVLVEIQDDGRGLDIDQIAKKAVAAGLVNPALPIGVQQAFELICMSGFTTAAEVTELAGRGIGMDVVKSSVDASGGRMEALSRTGLGLTVRLVLPLTTATTQVLLVRHGADITAVPVNMVEQVLRFTQKDLQQAYNTTAIQFGDEIIPFYWAGALLGTSRRSEMAQFRSQPVVVVRSAGRRVAMHVDETVGQQEVIVKSVGGQLSSLPGLTGVSVLPSGSIVLIYNPVALALVYGEQIAQFAADLASAGQLGQAQPGNALVTGQSSPTPVVSKKLVMVVDDSITVRKVTQRLLERAGYRVALAGDGVQALGLLRGELSKDLPFIVLADIEMPRMDGFDLVRTLSGDARLASIPVVMITSRLAEKHRELATRLGVKHYLGKPFAEDHLLSLVAQYSALADLTLPN